MDKGMEKFKAQLSRHNLFLQLQLFFDKNLFVSNAQTYHDIWSTGFFLKFNFTSLN